MMEVPVSSKLVLGIESSCDETALAVVDSGKRILASCVASQTRVHQQFGGVVPELAARDHLSQLSQLYKILSKELTESGTAKWQAIAVTMGPGLFGSLLVGVQFARGLSFASGKPLIPVDHVLAHFHGIFVGMRSGGHEPVFPALGCILSGGHTHLFYLHSTVEMELIAHTIDDACGECFDKVAKMLGLGYPGGPQIEKRAAEGDPNRYPMPQVMRRGRNLDLSYSGLKTHVYHLANRLMQQSNDGKLSDEEIADVAAGFQQEAFGQVARKCKLALDALPQVNAIYVAGGVACNGVLRQRISELAAQHSCQSYFPDPSLCTDNAVMIASMGYDLMASGKILSPTRGSPYTKLLSEKISDLSRLTAET